MFIPYPLSPKRCSAFQTGSSTGFSLPQPEASVGSDGWLGWAGVGEDGTRNGCRGEPCPPSLALGAGEEEAGLTSWGVPSWGHNPVRCSLINTLDRQIGRAHV